MLQSWRDLSFLHFSCDPNEIRPLVPEELEIDTFDGRAWVGLVPFRMEGIRAPRGPAAPWLSAFPETNVRTYVHRNGKEPGVWFFSLDALRWLACAYARWIFSLPYHCARMAVEEEAGQIHYRSHRKNVETDILVRPGEILPLPQPGTLDFFLIERYLLYSLRGGRLFTGQVHHPPYPIQSLDLVHCRESLLSFNRITAKPFEHFCFSRGVDVEVFSVRPAQ